MQESWWQKTVINLGENATRTIQACIEMTPPSVDFLKRTVAAARVEVRGNTSPVAFYQAMLNAGWSANDTMFLVSWPAGTLVKTRDYGNIILNKSESTLVTVVSTGDPLRWEVWNINLLPTRKMSEERDYWSCPSTGQEEMISQLVGNVIVSPMSS